jgi:hypothetical protein
VCAEVKEATVRKWTRGCQERQRKAPGERIKTTLELTLVKPFPRHTCSTDSGSDFATDDWVSRFWRLTCLLSRHRSSPNGDAEEPVRWCSYTKASSKIATHCVLLTPVLPALDSLNKMHEEVRSTFAEGGLYSKLLLKWTVGSEMRVSVGWSI